MSPQHKSENGSDPGLPPGADRFWGQFSEAKGGRSTSDEEPQAAPHQDEPEHGTSNGNGAGEPHAESRHECLEWCPICRSAELLKAAGVASPEIRQQLHTFQNEAVNILKAFAASYAEKTGEEPSNQGKADSKDRESGNGNGKRPPDPDEPKVTDISIE